MSHTLKMPDTRLYRDPIVVTGIGMLTSVGLDRESTWRAIQRGQSGIRSLAGVPGMPEFLPLGAPVPLAPPPNGELKVIDLARRATAESLADARLDLDSIDPSRVGCAVSSHYGDPAWIEAAAGQPRVTNPNTVPWFHQWFPNTASSVVANEFGLYGPRLSHSAACASGLIEVLMAMLAIRDGQCDVMVTGSSEAIGPLFAASFDRMRVLAHHEDPNRAARPFDLNRSGFVMGEGAAMLVLERLSHAQKRKARIYGELCGGAGLAEAHHVTDLDSESATLARAISIALEDGNIDRDEVGYISAHGTGTQQNDLAETRGIRKALGAAAGGTCISATKSMLGHLLPAAGIVELAITLLALRDGFAPPTVNLTDPDPNCDLDCIPLVGRALRFQTALKISVAFGGHIVAVALRRWNDPVSGFAYPSIAAAA